MKKITLLFLALTFYGVANGANWVSIKSSNMPNLVVDTASIQNYPGVVTLVTRQTLDKGLSGYFFKQSAFTCGSNEFWGISSTIKPTKDIVESELIPNLADRGFIEYLSTPSLISLLKTSCQGKPSRKAIEIPVSQGGDTATFVLAKDTAINGQRVSLWEKRYKFISEPYMSDGKPLVIDGQTITKDIIPDPLTYALDSVEYDCSAKTARFLSLNKYTSNNSSPSSINTAEFSKAEKIVPGSTGQKIMEFACGLR